VADGTKIALTAHPAPGSIFGGFSGGGCSATGPCTVAMDANKTVDAAFALTPTTDPPGLAWVCTQIRQIRALVAATLNEMIAQLPSLANKLAAIRDSALANLDSLLADFGCVPAAKAAEVAAATQVARPPLQIGTAHRDRLRGGAHNDVQLSKGGNDRITGGRGRDLMSGGPGNDRLDGGKGADMAVGGSGNDRLKGGPGTDLIIGGSGKDTIDARDGKRDYVACGPGSDHVRADKQDVVERDCEHVKRR
jgi:hypothetical protein